MADAPYIRWMIVHPNPINAIFRVQMDKATAIEFMKGMYAQVNDPKMEGIQYDLEMRNFGNMYAKIDRSLGGDNTKKS